MQTPTTRRKFLIAAGMTGAATIVAAQSSTPSQTAPAPKPPRLDPSLVKEFVIAGHGNLDRVREMLQQEPGLLNAAWDWGGGDFEMAIGGAGHMGRADIARFLISRGGRFDIFVASMLGDLEFVKHALSQYPNLAQSKGPHGISLAAHASKGGAAAEPVLRYLEAFGK